MQPVLLPPGAVLRNFPGIGGDERGLGYIDSSVKL